ncbi:MAG: hypothetical protein ACE14O_06850 [Candidatus Cloacimonadaceae bacterium]
MFVSKEFRILIDQMFVPPIDYDAIKVETRETPEEPILIITLYKNNEVIFFHNYAFESSFLKEERQEQV